VTTTATRDEDPETGRRGLIRRLYDQFAHLVHEIGKFGVVGGITFVVDTSLFNLFTVGMHLNVYLAKIISASVAATLAFLGNRFWTWRHREKSGLGREYVLYFVLNAVGLGIALACLGVSYGLLGAIWPFFRSTLINNISGTIIGTGLGTLFRFWSYRRWVFRRVEAPATR